MKNRQLEMKTLYLEKKSTHRIKVKNFFILVVTWLILKYDLKKKVSQKNIITLIIIQHGSR